MNKKEEHKTPQSQSGAALPHTVHHTKNSGVSKKQPMEYVEEAFLLLAYAAQQGIEVEQSQVATLVNAKNDLEQGGLSPEREIEFWMAFDNLSRAVQPVSIASLKATRAYDDRQNKQGIISTQSPKADRTIKVYQKWSLVILAFLLIVQVYWLIGSVIITAVAKEIPEQVKALELSVKEASEKLNLARQNENEADAKLAIEERDRAQNELKNLEDSKNAYYDSLRTWGNVLCLGVFCSSARDGTYYNEQGYIETRQAAQLVLQPIQLYLLPLLYGLLGASAYVLRSLSKEIKELTYTVDSNVRYRLRIQLGSLAGLAVGWFLYGPSERGASGLLISFQHLSPLALSFMAGYSVELLFTALDKIVGAFSAESPVSKK